MNISFDFDGCLADSKYAQLIAQLFSNAGHKIWILTSRDPIMSNTDVFNFAKKFNIPDDRIIMTNGTLKVHKFIELNLDMHFDNSWDEIHAINKLFDNDDSLPAIYMNFCSEEIADIITSMV